MIESGDQKEPINGSAKREGDDHQMESKKLKDAKQCSKCEEWRDWMVKYSPNVVFMLQQIEKAGDHKVPLDMINCEICKDPKYGGFHPELGIQLCANYITDKWVLNDTLSHELIHWYDNVRFKVDWLNLRHHACSEIRAASLSGECAIMTEFWKHSGFMRVAKGHQRCVKRKAILSVMGHPACKSKEQAEQVVDEVFRSCFNDTRPYESIYR
ncbi:hypothetical protein FOA43_003407 [Brettanomyces nanus]|uniref:Mitochondrial inner membrane protease ATP23 n=1 Tax=Eeniella nana TaxID=13502 RepID=A0A875S2T5_EENNA|nr:uncharacterized protein FOA43_003407 [Brettanomyces nanus]QPG76021.1 hypothetical protein FOA43_003407 [Brettanomyces nanus]